VEEYSVPPALSLEPGELVLLVTDGIVEAMSSDGRAFGLERTLGIVRAHQQEMPDAILQALFDALADFCERRFQDDLTAVVIKVES
jgi:serine phosphatase RsbU (regulator of sigma subunit)